MATDDDPGELAPKLGIRRGSKVAVVNEPAGWLKSLAPLPPEVALYERASEPLDVIVYFSDERANVERRVPVFAGFLTPGGLLWMATPDSSPELTHEVVVATGAGAGLRAAGHMVVAPGWGATRFERT